MIKRGEIWWANLPQPRGSEPGYRRPVLVVQSNAFNRSSIQTVLVVILTSNLRRAKAPGNVLLRQADTELPKDSVANVSQIYTIDKGFLTERVGALRNNIFEKVETGLRLVMAL